MDEDIHHLSDTKTVAKIVKGIFPIVISYRYLENGMNDLRNPKCTTYGIWDGKSVDKENHLCVLGHISYPLLTTLLSKWAPIYARVLSSLDERHFQNQFYYHHFYANCIYTNSLQYFVKEMGSSRTKISSHKNEQKVLFFFFQSFFLHLGFAYCNKSASEASNLINFQPFLVT